MSKFVIENGILKAYFGRDSIVVVPDGVTHVGGDLCGVDDCPQKLKGDSIGYKAFFRNKHIRELYLPDSAVEIGYKALEHCMSLETSGQTPDLDVVYCTDGEIRFGKQLDYYIDTLYFPGTRAEWNTQIGPDDWRNKRCRKLYVQMKSMIKSLKSLYRMMLKKRIYVSTETRNSYVQAAQGLSWINREENGYYIIVPKSVTEFKN